MKILILKISLSVICLLIITGASAQDRLFTDVPESAIPATGQKRIIVPSKYRTVQLDKPGLQTFIQTLPSEKSIIDRNSTPVILLPMPSGGFAAFHVWESAVAEAALLNAYPQMKTFTGQGIDDPTATIKLDWTPSGFHAMILSSLKGTVFIDPYSMGNTDHCISYEKKDYTKAGSYQELPLVINTNNRINSVATTLAGSCIGTQLRTYRLALAASAEYTTFHGGTVSGALAAQVTTINRVNGVYERELSIRLLIVANNNLIIYTNATTDPYTNNNPTSLLSQNQTNVDAVIGNANYDIGHVFTTGGGGVAQLGVVCSAGQKASGVTGTGTPIGDPFDIDYVAHEIGHQFGANHPFNSNLFNTACQGNGSSTTNAEPGSGSTIMAYAGICGSDNLQSNSDAQFHAVSLNEITNYIINGNGSNCAIITNTGNIAPSVNAGAAYTIPVSTPFLLTGTGTDANNDALTYSWEQVDVGGPFGSWNAPSGNAPLFRSFTPQAVPFRYFPRVTDVVAGINTIGELLPSYARTMHFRLTARDNRAGGGGVCFAETEVTLSNIGGPFSVTSPNTGGITWLVNDFKTITWNVAATTVAPINCTNVKIELSIDGGLTYPITILASTQNDGIEEIQVPNNISDSVRLRISAVGNIFYDISNANFTIQAAPSPEFVFNNPPTVVICNSNAAIANLKTASLNGFSTAINLSATGNPPGTSVSFGSTTLAPGAATTITLNNAPSLAVGSYDVTIIGVAGSVTKSRIITFFVNTTPVATANLSLPTNNSTGVGMLPNFNWAPLTGISNYTLEISTSGLFSTITQSIPNITILPIILTSPLLENTIYYWRVKSLNTCGDVAISVSGLFKTGITNCFTSIDVPLTIAATGTPVVNSNLTIPINAGAVISDLNVTGLLGVHTFISDLSFRLTNPQGNTSVLLFENICNDEQDFNLSLDDESVVSNFPCPPVGGLTVRPQNLLAAFDGQNSTGTWKLTVNDNFDADGGALSGWGLCIFSATPINTTPAFTQLCSPVASTKLISSITGASYQWQVNTGSGGFTNISNGGNFDGVNNAELQIINAPTSWNGYRFRCVVAGSNSTELTIHFSNYWNGSISNAWENAANWSCNVVPNEFTDVYINSGGVAVNSTAVCRSLKVSPGAAVTVNAGFKITVVYQNP